MLSTDGSIHSPNYTKCMAADELESIRELGEGGIKLSV